MKKKNILIITLQNLLQKNTNKQSKEKDAEALSYLKTNQTAERLSQNSFYT